MSNKRTLILGAGFSGLVSLKSVLESELGDVICYDQSYCIGGLWKFRKTPEKGQGSVIQSTVTNTSKEILCFSDFNIPDHWPNFLHHDKVLEYIENYADHFSLREHIKLSRKVTQICKDGQGRYDVTSVDLKNDVIEEEKFDYIIVCNGRFFEPNIVKFENQNAFKGPIIHSHDFRDVDQYRNKNVCIVGIGNTSLDIAIDLSRVCNKVLVSTRGGSYIRRRLGEEGLPVDCTTRCIYEQELKNLQPVWYKTTVRENELNADLNHALYGIKPKARVSKLFLTTNDEIQNRVTSGDVEFRRDIKRFGDQSIEFLDGRIDQVDYVIMATGYGTNTSFLSTDINIYHDSIELYKQIFLPTCDTMAFMGYLNPKGAVPPVVEMQARYAVQGNIKLPSEEKMKKIISKVREKRESHYGKSQKFKFCVNGYNYMQTLAKEIGCNIRWSHLILTDPVLAYHCFFGLYAVRQYRLYGPNQWSGARTSILNVWNRIRCPYGEIEDDKCKILSKGYSGIIKIAVFVLIMIYLFMKF